MFMDQKHSYALLKRQYSPNPQIDLQVPQNPFQNWLLPRNRPADSKLHVELQGTWNSQNQKENALGLTLPDFKTPPKQQ